MRPRVRRMVLSIQASGCYTIQTPTYYKTYKTAYTLHNLSDGGHDLGSISATIGRRFIKTHEMYMQNAPNAIRDFMQTHPVSPAVPKLTRRAFVCVCTVPPNISLHRDMIVYSLSLQRCCCCW